MLYLVISFLCSLIIQHAACEELVRLAEITEDEKTVTGFVEVFNKGQWQPLCGRRWLLSDATVVCRTLGFEKGAVDNPRVAIPSDQPKQRNWYYLFNGFRCLGDETSITECPYWDKPSPGVRNCSGKRAAAQCER